MSPTSRATWLNPINLARDAMPPLSPAPRPVATERAPLQLWYDRVGHGFQAVDVVGLQPLQHHPLHAGLVQAAELLGDLRRGADDDAAISELAGRPTRELALDVG